MSCNSAVVLFIWGLNLMQTVHDWELESILLFRELLYSASVRGFFLGGGVGGELFRTDLR